MTRFEYLDLLRVISVGLVMFGHFVSVAGDLTHTAIGLSVMVFVREYISQPYIMLMCAILASLMICWGLNRLIEKPFIDFSKKLIRHK